MKKYFILSAFTTALLMTACASSGNSEPQIDGVETTEEQSVTEENSNDSSDTNHYENSELGISFDYPSNWDEPEVDGDGDSTRIRLSGFTDEADSSNYVNGKYAWGLDIKEDMSKATIDPPGCEGDACAVVCQENTPCAHFSIYGYDYSDLDLVSTKFASLSEAELRNMEKELLSDEEVGGQRVMMIANPSPGMYLDVYISNGNKSVVMLVPFGFEKNVKTGSVLLGAMSFR